MNFQQKWPKRPRGAIPTIGHIITSITANATAFRTRRWAPNAPRKLLAKTALFGDGTALFELAAPRKVEMETQSRQIQSLRLTPSRRRFEARLSRTPRRSWSSSNERENWQRPVT